MIEGSTPTTPRRRRPVRTSEHYDPAARATCTKDGRPWHELGADGRAVCPVCYPGLYAAKHAKHRDDFTYVTTVPVAVTR